MRRRGRQATTSLAGCLPANRTRFKRFALPGIAASAMERYSRNSGSRLERDSGVNSYSRAP